MTDHPKLERLNEVIARTGLGRSAIYDAIAHGAFPVPVKLGPRAIAFVAAEIDAWIAQRIAERDQRARGHARTAGAGA